MPGGIYKTTLFVSLLFCLPSVCIAQVSTIVFSTEPQTVKPGEISSTITIQLRDSSGSSHPSTETVDIEFLSSSATGEFLSPTSGNAVTKTISTGSANKNFRYRDSTEGAFTLTVNAVGRTSLQKWSANQVIIISNSSSSSATSTATSTEETTATTTATTTPSSTTNTFSQSSLNTSSTHYSSAPVSSRKSAPEFEVSAGRDRLGSVGSPLEFEIETNIEYTKNSIFVWNFGDGIETVGELVTHTYVYPGDYLVVLNVSSPRGKAVSRTNVKIVDPKLEIIHVSRERIEIANNSESEVSLFGRALVTGDKIFSFSKDTIIKSGQKISFGANITGLSPLDKSQVTLTIVGKDFDPREIIVKSEEQKLAKVAFIHNEIARLELLKLARIQEESSRRVHTTIATERENQTQEVALKDIDIKTDTSQTALVLGAISTSTPKKVSSWLDTLRRFFLRTRE